MMASRLRQGDKSLINPICLELLPKVLDIAKTYGHDDEWQSTACVTLVESVHKACEELRDNEISPYVLSRIRWKLKDAYRESKRQHEQQAAYQDVDAPTTEGVKLEVSELITAAIKSDLDSMYVEMRAAAYSLAEIAEFASISISTLKRVGAALRARYDLLDNPN